MSSGHQKNSKWGHEINNRSVYAFRSIGQGFCGLERFPTVVNLPPSLTRNNYNIMLKKAFKITQGVAEETMKDAATIVHSKALKDENEIGNVGNVLKQGNFLILTHCVNIVKRV